jgi:hypothetical protein
MGIADGLRANLTSSGKVRFADHTSRKIDPLRTNKALPPRGVPAGREMGLAQGTLSSRGRDGVQRGLVVGDALFDLRDESRRVALHDLADARPKLAEKIYPGVAANRRTEVAERSRSGSRPIRTVSSVSSDRSQYPQEIRIVYSSFSRLVTRDKNVRSSVAGSAHKTVASRRVVTRFLLE